MYIRREDLLSNILDGKHRDGELGIMLCIVSNLLQSGYFLFSVKEFHMLAFK